LILLAFVTLWILLRNYRKQHYQNLKSFSKAFVFQCDLWFHFSMPKAAGSRLGPYTIVAALGAGGMGEVYRAKDPRLKREVAIKILPQDAIANPEREKRFEHEAQAASALNHPNILSIYDIGTEDGTTYIVSELVEGESLRKEIQKDPLPTKKLLDIATQIADGLAAAHQAGIIHRDLKPENIIVTNDGRVKILDFGLAKLTGLETGEEDAETVSRALTKTGMIQGTIPYMSPEQATGKKIDFRSDQFSFGSILYEMATGKRPFSAESAAQIMTSIISDEPEPIVSINPKIPAPVRWLTERCMSKEVRQRYDSTTDLYRELRTLRDHLSEATSTELMPALPRKKSVAGRVALGLAFLTLLTVVFLFAQMWLTPVGADLAKYRFTAFATDPGYEDQTAWSPDGKTLAFTRSVKDVLQIFTQGLNSPTATQLTRCSNDCFSPLWSPDGNHIFFSQRGQKADLWRISTAGGSPEKVLQDVWPWNRTISPDGKAIVFVRRESYGSAFSLWISAPIGSTPKPMHALPEKVYAGGLCHFSPDGSKIGIYVRPLNSKSKTLTEFWTIPFPKGAPVQVKALSGKIGTGGGFSWMPDSRRIVFESPIQDSGIHLWMADTTSEEIHPITATASNETNPSVSPDGNKIAFTLFDENFDLVEIPLDGSPLRNLLSTSRNESFPAWTPAGNQYAYVTDRAGDSEIWVKSPSEGWDQPLVTGRDFGEERTVAFSGPQFSPDGQRIAYERFGGKGDVAVWISNVAGGTPIRLVPNEESSAFGGVSWSPDGNWITWIHGEGGKYVLTKARVGEGHPILLKSGAAGVHADGPKWSPDGQWITFVSTDGFYLVSADGKVSRKISEENPAIQTWSKDGKTIYEVKQSGNLFLFDIATSKEKEITDLQILWGIAGASLAPDGKSIATSVSRLSSDIWLLEGFKKPPGFFDRFFHK
jgi:eukaryotic-like serine/threonine-protein kinase